MAAEVQIRPAIADDARELAPRMRAADVYEVWAGGHFRPEAALRQSLEVSQESWTAVVDGRPMAIWGIAQGTALSGIGTPWLLAAEGFPRVCLRQFLGESRRQVQLWLGDFDVLVNWVCARNHASIRWLTHLGAAFSAPEPRGPDGELFRRFEFRR